MDLDPSSFFSASKSAFETSTDEFADLNLDSILNGDFTPSSTGRRRRNHSSSNNNSSSSSSSNPSGSRGGGAGADNSYVNTPQLHHTQGQGQEQEHDAYSDGAAEAEVQQLQGYADYYPPPPYAQTRPGGAGDVRRDNFYPMSTGTSPEHPQYRPQYPQYPQEHQEQYSYPEGGGTAGMSGGMSGGSGGDGGLRGRGMGQRTRAQGREAVLRVMDEFHDLMEELDNDRSLLALAQTKAAAAAAAAAATASAQKEREREREREKYGENYEEGGEASPVHLWPTKQAVHEFLAEQQQHYQQQQYHEQQQQLQYQKYQQHRALRDREGGSSAYSQPSSISFSRAEGE
jgi:hypothetical protein